MGSATKLGIPNINFIEKTWEQQSTQSQGLKSEKQPNERLETPRKFIANLGPLLSHRNYKTRLG